MAVNVLTNTPKISSNTMGDIFQINFPQKDEKYYKTALMGISKVIAFELGVANSRNIEQDTCNRRSICQKRHLRFQLTLGETFSKPTSFRMMKKLYKIAVMEISQEFWTLSHVDCQSVL